MDTPIDQDSAIWVPDFMVEETMPYPRAKPEDWLIFDAESGSYFVGDDEDMLLVEFGASTVEFVAHRTFGTIELLIQRDGSYTASRPIDGRANNFWEPGDVDTLAPSLDEFAHFYAENGTVDPLGTSVTVEYYWWSDPVPFRLTATHDGAIFVRGDSGDSAPAVSA